MGSDTRQANEFLIEFFLKEGSNPRFRPSLRDFMNNSNKTFYPLRFCTLQGRAREKYHILVGRASIHGLAMMVEGGELANPPRLIFLKLHFKLRVCPSFELYTLFTTCRKYKFMIL